MTACLWPRPAPTTRPGEDIGRVKIPRWFTQYVGGPLRIDHVAGRDFPPDLASYRLVVHSGSCMLGRREMQSRLHRCREAGVPLTNYGVAIAFPLGILGVRSPRSPRRSMRSRWRGGPAPPGFFKAGPAK